MIVLQRIDCGRPDSALGNDTLLGEAAERGMTGLMVKAYQAGKIPAAMLSAAADEEAQELNAGASAQDVVENVVKAHVTLYPQLGIFLPKYNQAHPRVQGRNPHGNVRPITNVLQIPPVAVLFAVPRQDVNTARAQIRCELHVGGMIAHDERTGHIDAVVPLGLAPELRVGFRAGAAVGTLVRAAIHLLDRDPRGR
jgi:hypothetical protein